jgi:phospho-N-acetylmuramoyl-pentapeptide-transferase
MTIFTYNVIKILILVALSTGIAFLISGPLIKYLYKFKFWKKTAREKGIDGQSAPVFNTLHQKRETTVPRGGGVLIWLTVLILVIICYFLGNFSNIWWLKDLDFLSQKETWLPLFSLIIASILGLADDMAVVLGKGKYAGGGIRFWVRFAMVALIGLVGGLWFYFKLGWDTINIPLIGNFPEGINLSIGPFYIPLFIIITLACWSSGVVDGIDGLSGGVFGTIYGALGVIAFSQGKYDLATFCAVVLGTLFAFLWFNIPPAKFYMGETGILGLTVTMAVVSFLTDSVLVLPIIGGILVIEVASVIIQLISKKFFHKKIWLSTPIHHHLEAKGWPPYQITMRFWILSAVFAVIGVAIRLMR